MIKSLKIKNFRSVEDEEINLAPITLLYGPNASGKSSLFYALNVFKNVISNPNQPLDSFFNLGFINLGTFKQVVFKHLEGRSISISIGGEIQKTNVRYGIKLEPKQSIFSIELGEPYNLKLTLPVTFPYPLNANVQENLTLKDVNYVINWNGVSAQITPSVVNEDSAKQVRHLTLILNRIVEAVRASDIISHARGFTKPQYGAVNITQFPVGEDEVASTLAAEGYLDTKVNSYLEATIDRQFRVKTQLGSSLFALTTYEKETKNTVDIVNDGFGVNQLVYFFAKALNKNATTLCVEEPEVNLHPGIVRRLPKTFIDLVKEENKQLLISTHSEALVVALVAATERNEISKSDIALNLTQRTGGVTHFTKNEILDGGQIEGGLRTFMEGQLTDIKSFFRSGKKTVSKKLKETSETKENIEKELEKETEK